MAFHEPVPEIPVAIVLHKGQVFPVRHEPVGDLKILQVYLVHALFIVEMKAVSGVADLIKAAGHLKEPDVG